MQERKKVYIRAIFRSLSTDGQKNNIKLSNLMYVTGGIKDV